MTFSVYDPRGSNPIAAAKLAPRPRGLQGLTVGLLDNGKEQAEVLLERVRTLLEPKGLRFNYARKPSHSRVAPPEVLERLHGADLAITALGG